MTHILKKASVFKEGGVFLDGTTSEVVQGQLGSTTAY